MLSDANGLIRTDLVPAFDCLKQSSDSFSTFLWLRRPSTRLLFRDLVAASGPLSHEQLDSLEPRRVVHRLRFALMDGGVLPQRDVRIADLEKWIHDALTTVDRRAVEGFATWYHLRRLREQVVRKPVGAGQAEVARRQINAAVRLVNWLQPRGRSLATATQHHLDAWLAEGHWLAHHSRTFVTWAVRHGHAHSLNVPRRQPTDPEHFIEHDERWQLVRRLVHDTTVPSTQRLAGLLVLLFAQPVSRIAVLSQHDAAQTADGVTIALGAVPLALPPPLDALALESSPNPVRRAARWAGRASRGSSPAPCPDVRWPAASSPVR